MLQKGLIQRLNAGGGGSGDVNGPATSTDNAITRFDGTTGKLLQNSGAILDDSNNLSGLGTLASGAHTVTSSSATAVVAGANGATNPAFKVDASTASSATGLQVKSAAAGAGVTLSAISSATDESVTATGKGTGKFNIDGTAGTANAVSFYPTALKTTQITASFDTPGGGAIPSTSTTKAWVFNYNATITGWAITGDGTATIKWCKKAAGTTNPTISDSINTSGVQLTTGAIVNSTTLSDFTTTTITAGDIFICDYVSGTCTVCTAELFVTKT